jgi:hypothetical protein
MKLRLIAESLSVAAFFIVLLVILYKLYASTTELKSLEGGDIEKAIKTQQF